MKLKINSFYVVLISVFPTIILKGQDQKLPDVPVTVFSTPMGSIEKTLLGTYIVEKYNETVNVTVLLEEFENNWWIDSSSVCRKDCPGSGNLKIFFPFAVEWVNEDLYIEQYGNGKILEQKRYTATLKRGDRSSLELISGQHNNQGLKAVTYHEGSGIHTFDFECATPGKVLKWKLCTANMNETDYNIRKTLFIIFESDEDKDIVPVSADDAGIKDIFNGIGNYYIISYHVTRIYN